MVRLLPIGIALVCSAVNASCFEQAAARYHVAPELLRAVAIVESGGNPSAMNLSHHTRTGSYDIGLMQINSRWLPTLAKHGITEAQLKFDACLNAQVGAWILSETLRRHGNDWGGVGAYNAACTTLKGRACEEARNRYAWKVYRAMAREAGAPLSAASAPIERIAVLTLGRVSGPSNNKAVGEAE